MHSAENRLRNYLPFIINCAKEQIIGAKNCLLVHPISSETKRIISDLLGNSSPVVITNLLRDLDLLLEHVSRLTPQHFDIAEELYEAGKECIAYVKGTEAESRAFLSGQERTFISISYIATGKMHVEDIATTIIHEISHLVLKTEDLAYSLNLSNQAQGLFNPWSAKNLRDQAKNTNSAMLKNAESLARVTSLLHFSTSNDPEHIKLHELYWKSADSAIFAFHRLAPGIAPRISSPELARKTNTLRKINNHFVI